MDLSTISLPIFVSILYCLTLVSSQANDTLIVSTIEHKPYLMMKKVGSNGRMVYEGYIKDLMDELAFKLNFNYSFKLAPDNRFGAYKAEGYWTGMMGELVNGSVDLVAAALTISTERSKFVDFSSPFQTSGPVIVMRKPVEKFLPLKERLTQLLTPFDFSVWLTAVVSFMIASTIIYIVSYFNPYEWRRMGHDGEATIREMESFTCLNSFWFAISTMAWQGYTRSPRSMGGRIVVTFWWLFVIIFLSCYIASLTNLLRAGHRRTEMQDYSPIQSFADLSKQSQYKPLVTKDSSTKSFLKNAKIPYLKKIYNEIKLDPELMVESYTDAFKMLKNSRDENFAFISESQLARYETKGGDCSLYVVNDFIINRYYALAFPKSPSKLKEQINLAILELQENGFLNELEEQWFKGECDNYIIDQSYSGRIEMAKFDQLDLSTFSGALFILAVGLVFGGLVTIVEILLFKFAESEPAPGEPVNAAGDKHVEPGVTATLLPADSDVDKSGTTV